MWLQRRRRDNDAPRLSQRGHYHPHHRLYPSAGSGQAYDPLSRLTGAFYSTGEQFEYAYDGVGNRTAYTLTLGSTTVTTHTYTRPTA